MLELLTFPYLEEKILNLRRKNNELNFWVFMYNLSPTEKKNLMPDLHSLGSNPEAINTEKKQYFIWEERYFNEAVTAKY